MNYSTITVSLLAAFLLTLLFSRSFRSRGPFGGLLLFFLIIFLTTWSGQLWVNPISPVMWGIDWGLLLFTAIIFSLLMVALSAPSNTTVTKQKPQVSNQEAGIAIGIFFWVLIIILILSIISGYYKKTLPIRVPDTELITDH